MSRNIFRRRSVGLEAAGRHLRIISQIKSDNRKTTLNSLTQICFVFKSTCFGLDIDHQEAKKYSH
jgi:hypothetical protein